MAKRKTPKYKYMSAEDFQYLDEYQCYVVSLLIWGCLPETEPGEVYNAAFKFVTSGGFTPEEAHQFGQAMRDGTTPVAPPVSMQ